MTATPGGRVQGSLAAGYSNPSTPTQERDCTHITPPAGPVYCFLGPSSLTRLAACSRLRGECDQRRFPCDITWRMIAVTASVALPRRRCRPAVEELEPRTA